MIPPLLKSLRRWVCCWSNSKIPMRASSMTAASSTDPDTWSTWDEADTAVKSGLYDYTGFVFAEDGIVGIDIDVGFSGGLLTPLCADIISLCKSYTERSRSGRGVHILLQGSLPFSGRNNMRGVEIYQSGRFFIMTGKTLIFSDLIENQAGIDTVLERYFCDVPQKKGKGNTTHRQRIYNPVYQPPQPDRIRLSPDYPEIPEGGRNLSLLSLAGQMYNAGYDAGTIYNYLARVNKDRCKPPLPDGELKSIVRSISKYER